jgi:hypothetical protein
MKRRKFLKTVGSATGAAALGACVAGPSNSAQGNPAPGNTGQPANKGRPVLTMGMEEVTPGGAGTTAPFSTLRIRPPLWHPDGSSPDGGAPATGGHPQGQPRKQVFQEEFVGLVAKDKKMHSLPVEFEYKGLSKKWILGGSLVDPPPKGHEDFTALVRALAVKVRKYNASLYRLRRIHYCNKFKDQTKAQWPHPNPDGKEDTDPTSGDVSERVWNAEKNWCDVTDELDGFLETAKTSGYPYDPNNSTVVPTVKLVGLDMTAVNDYIIAMRVVVQAKIPGPPEVGGSSSQVSISSPFSSSAP